MNTRFASTSLLAMMAVALSGCALTYVDEQGYVNSIGFSRVLYRKPNNDGLTGDVIKIEHLGLGVSHLPNSTAITLGYSSESLFALSESRDSMIGHPSFFRSQKAEPEREAIE